MRKRTSTHHLDPSDFPKTIWMFWMQGEDNAPELVQQCIRTWRVHNPDWNVVVLDEESLDAYTDFPSHLCNRKDISVQKISNILRLKLLAEHGGVWVDATCLCRVPLNNWLLDRVLESGFFAFANPGEDRLLSSWFLAAFPQHLIVDVWSEAYTEYWASHRFPGPDSRLKKFVFHHIYWRYLSPPPHPLLSRLWVTYPATKWLRVTPYLSCHYIFANLVYSKPKVRDSWDQTPKVNADGPHRLKHYGLLNSPDESVKNHFKERSSPVYKLNWRVSDKLDRPGTLLHWIWKRIDAELKL